MVAAILQAKTKAMLMMDADNHNAVDVYVAGGDDDGGDNLAEDNDDDEDDDNDDNDNYDNETWFQDGHGWTPAVIRRPLWRRPW